MDAYQKANIVFGLCLYLPLDWLILKGKSTQNAATWLLWGLLDGLTAMSIFVQHGSWYLPAAYSIGSASVVLCIMKARVFFWTWFETSICVLVAISLVGWYVSGAHVATIMLATAVGLAGLPQLWDAYKKPHEMPFLIFLAAGFANAFSIFAGKGWTVEERLYPVICIFISAASVVVTGYRRGYFDSALERPLRTFFWILLIIAGLTA